MIWYDVKNRKPLATEIGCWDGLKSDKMLVYTRDGKYFIANMYHVIIDGAETFDFYDERDFEIKNVTYWGEIDSPV